MAIKKTETEEAAVTEQPVAPVQQIIQPPRPTISQIMQRRGMRTRASFNQIRSMQRLLKSLRG